MLAREKERAMDLGLKGKGALVVGAGADVGRATALLLAQEGARLVLAGRNRSSLEETARLAGHGEVVIADLASSESAGALVREAEQRLGGVDVLVNTVGPFPRDPAVPVPAYGHDESWLAAFDSLFLSAARLGREAIPLMKARGRGAVVNLAANSARHYTAGTGQYGAMKAALAHLTKNWARDCAASGVRVNAVLPGWIKGAALAETLRADAAAAGVAPRDLEADTMVGHDRNFWSPRMGTPEEYAAAIAFLVSDRASYINGALIPVDGGSAIL